MHLPEGRVAVQARDSNLSRNGTWVSVVERRHFQSRMPEAFSLSLFPFPRSGSGLVRLSFIFYRGSFDVSEQLCL